METNVNNQIDNNEQNSTLEKLLQQLKDSNDLGNEIIVNLPILKVELENYPIGKSGFIELIVDIMNIYDNIAPDQLFYDGFRILANLCVSNDENRRKNLESGSIDLAIRHIRQYDGSCNESNVIRTALALLLNSGANNDDINEKILKEGGLTLLADLVEPKIIQQNGDQTGSKHTTDITVVNYATRVIVNLVDSGLLALPDKKDSESEKIQKMISSLVKSLIKFIDWTATKDTPSEINQILENVIDILELVAMENGSIHYMIVNDRLFENLLNFLSQSKSHNDCKAVILKLIVKITTCDENMDLLFQDSTIFNKFLTWLNLKPKNNDLQMCAALCIGNLARNDKNCEKLVKDYEIMKPLLEILKTADSVKLQHSIVSTIKNLSLPAVNKDIIGSLGVIEFTATLLKNDVVPLQIAIIGIFKHLSNKNVINSKKIIMGSNNINNDNSEEPTPLSHVLALIQRTDDITIKNEVVNTNGTILTSSSDVLPSSSADDNSSELTPLLSSLLNILQNNENKYPEEIKINVCILLEKASKNSCGD
ncbi:1590_t:CDS:10, partial [Entrophospora sp. SA101]